jgi:undecaprenyl-diphosphatase
VNDFLLAAILGIVEGLTEFLPVSSTAHIRLVQGWLAGRESLHDNFWKLFAVAIQLPAVMAVVLFFWPTIVKFVKSYFTNMTIGQRLRHPVSLVLIATAVTGGPAKVLKHVIKDHLESLYIMGGALIVGGIVMAVVDTIFGRRERALLTDAQAAAAADQPVAAHTPFETIGHPLPPAAPTPAVPLVTKLEQMTVPQAIWIGAVQILSAVFPGTSRSMSTIAAGQVAGLTRAVALEFSFFLSIPIMFLAFLADMKDSLTRPTDLKPNPDYIGRALTSHDYLILMTGSIVSFIVALVVIAWFMAWVRRRGFLPFAVYRVIIGLIVLAVAARG